MECFGCMSLLEEGNNFFLSTCGQPFCQKCSVTQSHELTCSTCKTNISSLSPPRYLLADQMMGVEDRLTDQSCAICEETHLATNFCLDCQEAFCEEFATKHERLRHLNNHTVVSIEELNQYRKSYRHLVSFLHHKSCIQHYRPFEFLDLETKTHNKMLCSECSGNSTSLTSLDKCASSLLHKKLEHIRELGSQGTALLAKLREEEESFSSRLKDLEESRARSLSEIRRVFGTLHEALQTRQSELEREVEEVSKSAGFALSEERERSRVWQGQLSMLEKCVEEINLPDPATMSHFPSPPPPGLNPKKRPLPPSSTPHFLSEKALMVDACLLEDALRSSLSSSRASSSLTDVQSRVRVSEIRDRIEFLINSQSSEGDKLESLLDRISSMLFVTSTSSCPFRSDWSKNKVQSVMTFYSKGNGTNQLFCPYGMTYSPDSKLFYVCDSGNHRIQVFRNHPQAELEGRVEIEFLPPLGSTGSKSISSGLALNPLHTTPFYFSFPSGICYHDGQLFIVDQYDHRVHVWRAKDNSLLWTDIGQLNGPWACTVYQNHLFVSDYKNHHIQKFSLSDFSVVKVIGSEGEGLGQLSCPTGLSVSNGKLYVADYSNNRISVFDPESGAALSVIGPSLPNDENLSSPRGVLFSHNLLFVSSGDRISVFDSDHNYLYSFGSYGSGAGQFSTPRGMVMVDDKLFVCDSINNGVQILEQKLD